MNRFHEAAMSDEELLALTTRFAEAARLLGVDELRIEHNTSNKMFMVNESVMSMRLGTRWLSTALDWMTIEDARENKFTRLSEIAIKLAQRLSAGGGGEQGTSASRWSAIAGEIDLKEKTDGEDRSKSG